MLAPENTLAAVELAEVHDAFGFETTVRISSDGEPFYYKMRPLRAQPISLKSIHLG